MAENSIKSGNFHNSSNEPIVDSNIDPEKVSDNQKTATKKRKSSDPEILPKKTSQPVKHQSALKCIAIRPGILRLGQESSDSDDSSDGFEEYTKFDLLGRKIKKKCELQA